MGKCRVGQVIAIGDTHCGCMVGLCPPRGATQDGGGTYRPNRIQRIVWGYWRDFNDHWIPYVTQGEPYHVAFMGDLIDGNHHNSVHQFTHNLATQRDLAVAVLAPVVQAALSSGGLCYAVRGTEAHVGQSGQDEESVAKELGVIPNSDGQYARPELWLQLGKGLVHFMHHIGTTGSSHYESTAVHKELTESFQEAGRWKERRPDCIVRAHRHRSIETRIPVENGQAIALVLPGWQGKTPFAYKIPGGRVAPPQFGGACIRWGDDELYARCKVWSIRRPKPEGC